LQHRPVGCKVSANLSLRVLLEQKSGRLAQLAEQLTLNQRVTGSTGYLNDELTLRGIIKRAYFQKMPFISTDNAFYNVFVQHKGLELVGSMVELQEKTLNTEKPLHLVSKVALNHSS